MSESWSAKPSRTPTDRQFEVWNYIEILGHSYPEAAQHFGCTLNNIKQLLDKYVAVGHLPPDYIQRKREEAKRIAGISLQRIREDQEGGKADLHTAVQVCKGTGILVDRVESHVTYESATDPVADLQRVLDIARTRATPTSTGEKP